MASTYRSESITLRQASPSLPVEAIYVRFDPHSGRMVFEHLAHLVGSLESQEEAADLLSYAAGIHSARVYEARRQAGVTPAGG